MGSRFIEAVRKTFPLTRTAAATVRCGLLGALLGSPPQRRRRYD